MTGAAALSSAVALLVVELVPSGLSSVSAAVSETALTDYLWSYQWFTVSLAVAGLAAALGARHVFSRRAALLTVLLLLFAAGRSVVGWVPLDAPGAETTTTGTIHTLMGTVTFVSFVVLALVATSAQRWFVTASRALGLVGLGCLLLMGPAAGVLEQDAFGLVQRTLYVAILAWFGCCAAAAMRPDDRHVMRSRQGAAR